MISSKLDLKTSRKTTVTLIVSEDIVQRMACCLESRFKLNDDHVIDNLRMTCKNENVYNKD